MMMKFFKLQNKGSKILGQPCVPHILFSAKIDRFLPVAVKEINVIKVIEVTGKNYVLQLVLSA
jgi:hypothetical protein